MDTPYYIDTNVVIYLLVEDKKFGLAAKRIFERAIKGELRLFTSAYLLAESFATLRAFGFSEEKVRDSLKNVLEFGIDFLPLNDEIIRKVPFEMEKGTKFGDAVHLITMHEFGLKNIITEDKHFDNFSITRIGCSEL